jgi:hypothetical protein
MSYHKIAEIDRNNGLNMYATLYRWFTEVSGLGLAEQAKRLMQPDTPKKEEDMAEALDNWEDKCKRLTGYGEKYKLPPVYKIVALRSLTIGKARDHFDQWEAEDTSADEDVQFENLLNKVKDYARNNKLDGKGSAMKVGGVEKDDDSTWGSSLGGTTQMPPEVESWINAMSKGKGKSKGKGGGFQGKCYNCNELGHLARDCTKPKGAGKGGGKAPGAGFQGQCYNCGIWGHSAKFCSKPKGKGKGKGGKGKGIGSVEEEEWDEEMNLGPSLDSVSRDDGGWQTIRAPRYRHIS